LMMNRLIASPANDRRSPSGVTRRRALRTKKQDVSCASHKAV
jgi:hypothetical protein